MAEQREASSQRRDYHAGGLMILLGLGAAVKGASYDVGSLSDMGPGFFPVAIGVVMTLAGVGICASTIAIEPEKSDSDSLIDWRGWACILLGIAAFIVLGHHGGLLPATFATVFISSLGDRKNTLRDAFLLAMGMCVIAVVVFWWALQVQFPLFQWG